MLVLASEAVSVFLRVYRLGRSSCWLGEAEGAVALREAGAGVIVDPGWLDRQGQLVEGSQDPEVCYFLDSEFVVAAADVLHERGTVNLLADKGVRGSLGQDGVAVVPWSGGCRGQSGDLVPGGESGGHLVSVLGRGESVALRSEVR